MPHKLGRPRADANWPKPFCDMSYRMERMERWAIGRCIKKADGGAVDVDGILALDEREPFGKPKTRISFLTNVIAGLQKVGDFDVRPIAMRLADVRWKNNVANAAANPKPQKEDLLERIPGWPALYAAHWRSRLLAMKHSLQATLEAALAGADDDEEKTRRSSLLNTRSAFCRLVAFCEREGPGDVPPGDFVMDIFEHEIMLWWD